MHAHQHLRQAIHHLWFALPVILFYSVIVVIMTWPLITIIDTHIPDFFNDGLLHAWNSWWVQKALGSGQNPFNSTALFFPNGVSLATHNIAWFHVIPSILLSQFVNSIAAYNIAVLLNLVLCGSATFLLAFKLTYDAKASLIAGIIYQAWPYRLYRLDLPNLLATYWIPLFFLFLIYSLRHGRRRDFVLTGVCFALVGYTRWQLLIPAAIMGTVFFLLSYPQWDLFKKRFILRGFFLSAAVALTLLSPAVTAIWLDQRDDQSATLIYEGEETKLSADLYAFLTPSENHPLFGESTKLLYKNYYSDRESTRRRPAYIGVLVLMLSIVGIAALKKQSLPWIGIALTMMALALGPTLRVNGVLYEHAPTLYGLLSPLQFVRLIRNPERFTMFIALPMSILSAYGVLHLLKLKIFASKSIAYAAVIFIGAAIMFDYFSPQSTFKNLSQPPEIYAQIASEPGEFAILNLPFDTLKGSIYMYDQTLHQKAILQGNLSRIPPKAHDYFRENHYLNSLLYVNEFDPNLNDASQFLDRLVEDNIRYIVIHKNLVGQNRIDHWQRYLLIEPVYEDGRLIVYATETQSSQNTILQNELYPGLGVVDSNSIASCLLPNDIFELTIGWRVTDKQTAPLEAVFELQSENRQTSQSERFLINGKPWEKGTSTWGNYLFRLNDQLMAGTYSIRLGVAQKDQQPGRWHLIDTFSIQPRGNSHCELTESGLTPSGAVFGEQIRLVSYKANQNDSAVILDLAWQADQRIGQEYTVFLHLFDPNVGTPVAQSDAPPRQNSLPTRFWWPGEIITDTIVIPLNSVPQGEYRLALGIYLPETGERLNLKTPSGFSVEDNRLILDSTITIE